MSTPSVVVRSCQVVRLPAVGPGSVLPAQDLHLADGRISAVVPTGGRPVPTDARVIEAAGLVAMPGLTNAHSHMPMVLMRRTSASRNGSTT